MQGSVLNSSPNLRHLGTFDNYSALILAFPSAPIIGTLAYAKDSQGTAWLPGSLGGTFFSKGTYLWNGTIWSDGVDEISKQLYDNQRELKDTDGDTSITVEQPLGTDTDNIVVRTNGAEVMRIDELGNVSIGAGGTANVFTQLELRSVTKAFLLNILVSAAENAITGTDGMVIYNKSMNKVRAHINSIWESLATEKFAAHDIQKVDVEIDSTSSLLRTPIVGMSITTKGPTASVYLFTLAGDLENTNSNSITTLYLVVDDVVVDTADFVAQGANRSLSSTTLTITDSVNSGTVIRLDWSVDAGLATITDTQMGLYGTVAGAVI